MITLDLVNNVLSLIGERPIASTTGSMGGITRLALTTAIQTLVQQARPSAFEQLLVLTATNDDYSVAIGSIPNQVCQVYRCWTNFSATWQKQLLLENQTMDLLPYSYSYSLLGNLVYLTPMLKRPINVSMSVLVIPVLTADDADSGLPDYLIPAICHTTASILAMSYLDDMNASAAHRNIAQELTSQARLSYGRTRARSFNIGGVNV